MPTGSLAVLRPRRIHALLAPLLLIGFLGSCDAAPPPEASEALATRYPEDRATGYEAGELRGVIRVEIPGDAIAP